VKEHKSLIYYENVSTLPVTVLVTLMCIWIKKEVEQMFK